MASGTGSGGSAGGSVEGAPGYLDTLAKGVSSNPPLAAIVLVVLGMAWTVLAFGSAFNPFASLGSLVGLALVALLLIYRLGVKAAAVAAHPTVSRTLAAPLDFNSEDTMEVADRLNLATRDSVRLVLAGAGGQVASFLGLDPAVVRANIFGRGKDGQMHMITDYLYHMDRIEEWGVTMPIGYGSTGICFKDALDSMGRAARVKGNVATYLENWKESLLAASEMAKVHPALRWILSYPVSAPGVGPPKYIWVLNVDGLRDLPPDSKLQEALAYLLPRWSQTITLKLGEYVLSKLSQ